MKQGKFASAIDQYDLALQVAPNNPLIPLGRANAELGATSYRSAESHIRAALAADPALLHAQFDLNQMIGAGRLKAISDDLKDLATKEPANETASFLLAYLSYNTGHEADAMTYLADSEKRSAKPDGLVKRMREHWQVPAAGSGLNK